MTIYKFSSYFDQIHQMAQKWEGKLLINIIVGTQRRVRTPGPPSGFATAKQSTKRQGLARGLYYTGFTDSVQKIAAPNISSRQL